MAMASPEKAERICFLWVHTPHVPDAMAGTFYARSPPSFLPSRSERPAPGRRGGARCPGLRHLPRGTGTTRVVRGSLLSCSTLHPPWLVPQPSTLSPHLTSQIAHRQLD